MSPSQSLWKLVLLFGKAYRCVLCGMLFCAGFPGALVTARVLKRAAVRLSLSRALSLSAPGRWEARAVTCAAEASLRVSGGHIAARGPLSSHAGAPWALKQQGLPTRDLSGILTPGRHPTEANIDSSASFNFSGS